jgi:hypothetical protein
MAGAKECVSERRGCLALFSGCLTKLVLMTVGAVAFMWVLAVALNP